MHAGNKTHGGIYSTDNSIDGMTRIILAENTQETKDSADYLGKD